jgi:hypothetical protein
LTDKTSGGQPHVLTGILFICGAGILFPVMNGFACAISSTSADSAIIVGAGLSIGWSQRKPA